MDPRRNKIAGPAARLGLTPEAYLAKIDAGLKWCWRCREWHPIGDFPFDRSKSDQRFPVCKTQTNRLANARARARGVPPRRP